jgi:hypothetical protein
MLPLPFVGEQNIKILRADKKKKAKSFLSSKIIYLVKREDKEKLFALKDFSCVLTSGIYNVMRMQKNFRSKIPQLNFYFSFVRSFTFNDFKCGKVSSSGRYYDAIKQKLRIKKLERSFLEAQRRNVDFSREFWL